MISPAEEQLWQRLSEYQQAIGIVCCYSQLLLLFATSSWSLKDGEETCRWSQVLNAIWMGSLSPNKSTKKNIKRIFWEDSIRRYLFVSIRQWQFYFFGFGFNWIYKKNGVTHQRKVDSMKMAMRCHFCTACKNCM